MNQYEREGGGERKKGQRVVPGRHKGRNTQGTDHILHLLIALIFYFTAYSELTTLLETLSMNEQHEMNLKDEHTYVTNSKDPTQTSALLTPVFTERKF